jgi:hypothetical protein
MSCAEVITKLEQDLFLAVTSLTVQDFQLLVRLKVFNTEQMNQAVFAFRRYEDASLGYTGIEGHEGLTHYDSMTPWWRGSERAVDANGGSAGRKRMVKRDQQERADCRVPIRRGYTTRSGRQYSSMCMRATRKEMQGCMRNFGIPVFSPPIFQGVTEGPLYVVRAIYHSPRALPLSVLVFSGAGGVDR